MRRRERRANRRGRNSGLLCRRRGLLGLYVVSDDGIVLDFKEMLVVIESTYLSTVPIGLCTTSPLPSPVPSAESRSHIDIAPFAPPDTRLTRRYRYDFLLGDRQDHAYILSTLEPIHRNRIDSSRMRQRSTISLSQPLRTTRPALTSTSRSSSTIQHMRRRLYCMDQSCR